MIVSTLSDAELAEAVAAAHRAAVAASVEARARSLLYADLAARELNRRASRAGLCPDDVCDYNGSTVKFCGVSQCPSHGARVLIAYRNNADEWGPVREVGPDAIERLKKRTSIS